MKKIALLIVCFTVKYSNASSVPQLLLQDTLVQQKAYKLTREQFLAAYGSDDSSRALINFYFHKRTMHKRAFFTGAGLAMIAGVASFPVSNMSDNYGYLLLSDKGILLIGISILASAAVPLILAGGSLWMRYSRSRLLKMLNNYCLGKPIPRGIKANIVFRAYLRYGEWRPHIKRMVKAEDAHRKKEQKKVLRDAKTNKSRFRQPQNVVSASAQ